MTVIEQPDGKYYVAGGAQMLAGPFETHAEAWRALDRMTGDPINPAEKKSQWIASKIIGGAA
ncbi:hypothetical protein DKP76_10465 [Falsochrobactrum shanghaiense]|uniref:Uncharacterized protein n=1 Tax=Falsochrobactrum shanghaiense TaxID=2201899 RepID=A0A316JFZ1_9HYPH|nr:hypothetical protein [Falsochrobactrum shanghaiense]PWL18133.1 hypothetical protein DKP76_10465 [Falsochrobactrum shanghaiense]